MSFLYEKLETIREVEAIKDVPSYISNNLNSNFELRNYQIEAFENFVTYYEGNLCQKPTQTLFHMATGSGKTLIMAGLMLYLYKQGYRNFLFFVNLSTIVEKTKDNFINHFSSKYLFDDEIVIDGDRVEIQEVDNFQYSDSNKINICFTTTQGLHTLMWSAKENAMTFDDFDNQKVVLVSDEAHHLNVDTKKMTKEEKDNYHSWEHTVKSIFNRNRDNILLEFTATCDLENIDIKAAYENKIIYDYPLHKYYQDKYSKDILTLRSELSIDERSLQALILSQYRLKVFQDHRLSIKPVVLFKSQTIPDSKNNMKNFLSFISKLTGEQIEKLYHEVDVPILNRAFQYYADNNISFDVLAQEIKDEFSEEHCISVNSEDDAEEKQVLLNSLEDADNPYRAIFEVKKLDEGWDVLNLFDIVRLYETRQSGGKRLSKVTISEAQLIGRGARYCPFLLDAEQEKFKRKYDDDITNEMRVCEELYYHCQNDHRYIAELHTALKEIGLDPNNVVKREYILKDSFKKDMIYKEGYLFINDRILVDRKEVHELLPKIRDDIYQYKSTIGSSGTDVIMVDSVESEDTKVALCTTRMSIAEIAKTNYAIVNKALMQYPIFKFNTLCSYFPNIESTRDFIMDEKYIGGIKIDIMSIDKKPTMQILYNAVFKVLGKVADTISRIEDTYIGAEEFKPKKLHDIFTNKTVNYTNPHGEGKGVSQNAVSISPDLKIDLSQEDWFAYEDNFGTSEEKAFVSYFKKYVNELKDIYEKVVLIRNERVFHIYSFDNGERFEPDYVLLLQKEKNDGYEQIQIFIEPKGTPYLEKDSWKEKFLLQLKEKAVATKLFVDDNDYKIWGLHFFNQETRMPEFNKEFNELIKC